MPVSVRFAHGRTGLDVGLPDGASVLSPHELPPLRYCAEVEARVATLASEIEAAEGRAATAGVLPYGQQAVPLPREPVPA